MHFVCPYCLHACEIDEGYAGQEGPCRSCGRHVRVPADARAAERARRRIEGEMYWNCLKAGTLVTCLLVGVLTLFLLTLPELGTLWGAVTVLASPQASDEAYRRAVLGHVTLLLVSTAISGVLAACLLAVLAALGVPLRSLQAKVRLASWLAAATAGLSVFGYVVPRLWFFPGLTPPQRFGLWGSILLATLLAAALGLWRGTAPKAV